MILFALIVAVVFVCVWVGHGVMAGWEDPLAEEGEQ